MKYFILIILLTFLIQGLTMAQLSFHKHEGFPDPFDRRRLLIPFDTSTAPPAKDVRRAGLLRVCTLFAGQLQYLSSGLGVNKEC